MSTTNVKQASSPALTKIRSGSTVSKSRTTKTEKKLESKTPSSIQSGSQPPTPITDRTTGGITNRSQLASRRKSLKSSALPPKSARIQDDLAELAFSEEPNVNDIMDDFSNLLETDESPEQTSAEEDEFQAASKDIQDAYNELRMFELERMVLQKEAEREAANFNAASSLSQLINQAQNKESQQTIQQILLMDEYDDIYGKKAFLRKCGEFDFYVFSVPQVLDKLAEEEVRIAHQALGDKGVIALAESLKVRIFTFPLLIIPR